MKKYLATIISIIMCLFLAACGSKTLEPEASTPAPSQSNSLAEPDGSIVASEKPQQPLSVPEGQPEQSSAPEVQQVPKEPTAMQEELDEGAKEMLDHIQELLDEGKHPYDYNYVFFAEDTGRQITREEYDSFMASGRTLYDPYLDSEHEAGLY